jgi:hypothetical protein
MKSGHFSKSSEFTQRNMCLVLIGEEVEEATFNLSEDIITSFQLR